MANDDVLTAEDVAALLHIGRNTVYSLAKSGELGSYRIGRKLRFTQADVQGYIERSRGGSAHAATRISLEKTPIVICGQDIILDVLSNYMTQAGFDCLRAYVGSYDALSALYKGDVQVASAHLWDGDTGAYNTPYVKRLLPGVPAVVVHLTDRTQGFYVRPGNPKGLSTWADLAKPGVMMVNREKGAGSRVLLDEHLRLLGIDPYEISGYANEVQSHIAVASAVARGHADVAVGSEKVARQVEGIEFVPLQKERYDLVVRKADFEKPQIQAMMQILESGILRDEFAGLGGYDTSDMGSFVVVE